MAMEQQQESGQWSQDELERAMRESLSMHQRQPQPGIALYQQDLQRQGLYFEAQAAGSDTCGLNALNNLCQRPQFHLKDLQKAEEEYASAHDGSFAHVAPPQNLPTGFFDVEALKIAASRVELEIVDVEPVPEFTRSPCAAFVDAAKASSDGSWFVGFIVYDRRPGHVMHYYALRRDERYEGVWVKLDSQLPDPGEDIRNRRLTADDLRAFYDGNAEHFQAWLLRWYPVVYRKGAAREVCQAVALCKRGGAPSAAAAAPDQKPTVWRELKLSDERALRALKVCGWNVAHARKHLVEDLPVTTVRELLVQFARPSEAEMRGALEQAAWNVTAAQPAIAEVLKQRIALAQNVTAGDAALEALGLCGWEPTKAATLIALQLRLGVDESMLGEMCEALELAGGNADRAEAVVHLAPAVGSTSQAKALLEQLRGKDAWSLPAARRVLEVRKRFPAVSTPIVLECLRRNDDDPHAACEMLSDFQQRVRRLVRDSASQEGPFEGEEVEIADNALNSADWDPSVAFVAAKNLTAAVQQTRRVIRSRGYPQHFGVDVLLPALTAGDMKPPVAASFLLGGPMPQPQARREAGGYAAPQQVSAPTGPYDGGLAKHQQMYHYPQGQPGQPPMRRKQPPQQEDDDYGCSIA